jgi:hypothetical protein
MVLTDIADISPQTDHPSFQDEQLTQRPEQYIAAYSLRKITIGMGLAPLDSCEFSALNDAIRISAGVRSAHADLTFVLPGCGAAHLVHFVVQFDLCGI